MASMADRRNPQARQLWHPCGRQRRQFRAGSFRRCKAGTGCGPFPGSAGAHSPRLRFLRTPAVPETDGRKRRGEYSGSCGAQGFRCLMSEHRPQFKKIALIGVGLIGSSIAHAARRRNLVEHIAGYVPRAETRAKAQSAGFAHSLHAELAPAVADADLVMLATPIGTYATLAPLIAPHMMKGA